MCGNEGHMARNCPRPWGPPRGPPTRDDPENGEPENADNAPVREQVGVNEDNTTVSPVGQPVAGDSAVGQASVLDDDPLVVADPVQEEAPTSVGASAVVEFPPEAQASSGAVGNSSEEIGEFSSSQSQISSQSISEFTEESQSILCDVQIEVIDSGNSAAAAECPEGMNAAVDVVEKAASASDFVRPENPTEEMDSSVTLKRKDRSEDSESTRRLSRSKSRPSSRKLRASASSASPSPGGGAVHRRLPVISPSRPSEA